MAICEACKELSKVYDGSQQLITAKFTNKKTGMPTFLLVQEKHEDKEPQSVTIEVNYCPWCGRYLRGTTDQTMDAIEKIGEKTHGVHDDGK